MKHYTVKKESELDAIAQDILHHNKNTGRIYALYGKMGSGKTTLIKAFCRALNTTEPATSPTFAIVNEYSGKTDQKIFHFDFYRIEKVEEAFDLGYEEYFYDNSAICFIEWPEMIEELLPKNHIKIEINETENKERDIKVIQ
jgi:tRNA threonylcarbamoyladenosine biosynthesis protein TsaE